MGMGGKPGLVIAFGEKPKDKDESDSSDYSPGAGEIAAGHVLAKACASQDGEAVAKAFHTLWKLCESNYPDEDKDSDADSDTGSDKKGY